MAPLPVAVEPIAFAASARLDPEHAHSTAVNAAPRGPELRIAAYLEPGAGSVQELEPEANPEAELSEESP